MIPTTVGTAVALALAVGFGWMAWRSRNARSRLFTWLGMVLFGLLGLVSP